VGVVVFRFRIDFPCIQPSKISGLSPHKSIGGSRSDPVVLAVSDLKNSELLVRTLLDACIVLSPTHKAIVSPEKLLRLVYGLVVKGRCERAPTSLRSIFHRRLRACAHASLDALTMA
jgi:hypothetical protein